MSPRVMLKVFIFVTAPVWIFLLVVTVPVWLFLLGLLLLLAEAISAVLVVANDIGDTTRKEGGR